MDKIGILTFHRAINYGAVLQTFALNKYINKFKVCETIDYRCKYIESTYKLIPFDSKNVKKTINSIINVHNNIVRKHKFNKFLKENVNLSKLSYNTHNISSSNDIYDIYITGSDQVWNLDLCDDFNYYLSFVNNKNVRTAYAASFGNIDILNKQKENIEKELSKYKYISVREKSASKKIKEELSIDATHVLDPTFLLKKNEWEKVSNKKYNKEKFVLLYVLHEESAYKIAEKISQEKGIKVYVITQSRIKRIHGKYIRNAGPSDFISLIKNCEYVVTDSFHGTALSIIFRKNLKVVLKKENIFLNDRLLSVIESFNLNECIVNENTNIDTLTEITNYEDKEIIINKKIKESQNFILELLK